MSNADVILDERTHKRPRVLFFGMRCAFSSPPLQALLEAGCDLGAVFLPAPPGAPAARVRPASRRPVVRVPLNGLRTKLPTVDELAESANVPVVEIAGVRSSEVRDALSAFAPDVIAVACFPWRIPASVRALPPLGCVNVHPSLLPRWRGPEPLFWTFRAGDSETGVTVHLMDDGFDTGPILRQARLEVSRGVHGIALEHTLATIGGQLLVEAIAGLADGSLEPVAQDETLSTTAELPTDEDLVIGTDMPASRVVDLIRGIVPLWGPLTLRIVETGEEFSVNGVLDVDPDGILPEILVRTGDVITVRCNPGVATLTFAMTRRVGPLTPPMSV